MATTRKQMFLEKMNGGSLSTPTPVTIEEEILDGTSGHTLPAVSPSDADKVLQVVNGKWVADWVDRSTTLFTDGTLIINEKLEDRDSNISKHGAVVKEYEPFGEKNPYHFSLTTTGGSTALWYNDRGSVLSVEIGSKIAPKYLHTWFYNLTKCTQINLALLDTSNTISFSLAFAGCSSLRSVDISLLNTSNAKYMDAMFTGCQNLEEIDFSSFDTSKVLTFANMLSYCKNITIFNLINFNTTSATNLKDMFKGCTNLRTIMASDNFITPDDKNKSSNMFLNCTSLVGGNGTVYDSSHTDAEYARIDTPEHAGYFTSVEQYENGGE